MEGTFENQRIAQRRPVSVSVPTRDKLLFVGRVEFPESKLVLTNPRITVTTSVVETVSVEVQPQQQYSQLTPIYKKPEPVQPTAPRSKGIEWKHAHAIVPHTVKQPAVVQQPVVEQPLAAIVEVPIAELMRLELKEQILTAVVDTQDPVEIPAQQRTELPVFEITTDSTTMVNDDLANSVAATAQPSDDRLSDLRQYFQQSFAQQGVADKGTTNEPKPKVSKLYRIIRPIAFVVILVCAPSAILALQSNSTPSQPANKPAYAQQASAAKTAPAASVAPDEPKYITISKLGIHAPVTSVGLTTPGAVDSPADASSAGWYNGSVKPGQPGATYIDGSALATQGAVFSHLDTLVSGDQIQIEKGDGTIITYQVARTATVPNGGVDITSLLKPYSGTSGLNISTVTGDSAGTSNNTKDVFIVYAVQV